MQGISPKTEWRARPAGRVGSKDRACPFRGVFGPVEPDVFQGWASPEAVLRDTDQLQRPGHAQGWRGRWLFDAAVVMSGRLSVLVLVRCIGCGFGRRHMHVSMPVVVARHHGDGRPAGRMSDLMLSLSGRVQGQRRHQSDA